MYPVDTLEKRYSIGEGVRYIHIRDYRSASYRGLTMGIIKSLKSAVGLETPSPEEENQPTCIGCGRAVVNHGDICEYCSSEGIDRLGH